MSSCRAHPDCFGLPRKGTGLCETHGADRDAPPVSGYCRCDKPHPLRIALFATWQCGRCYRPLTPALEARLIDARTFGALPVVAA